MAFVPNPQPQLLRLLSLQSAASSSAPARPAPDSAKLTRWAEVQMLITTGAANEG